MSEAPDRAEAITNYPTILDDPEARKYVASAPYHGYGNRDFDGVAALIRRYPALPFWMTEVCWAYEAARRGTSNCRGTTGRTAITGAIEIFSDIEAGASAWIYWNMILNENGGPWMKSEIHGNPDPNVQQPVVVINSTTKKVSYLANYYYLAHFSKFVRPGAVRLKVTGASDGIRALAFRSPDGGVVLEVLNRRTAPAAVDFRLARPAAGREPSSALDLDVPMENEIMERRTFLAMMAAAGAAAASSDDNIRVGVIGTGSRGQYLIGEFIKAGAPPVAICDVYEPNVAESMKLVPGAKVFDDYRRMLDSKAVDAVVIATPDHWHCRMAQDAVEAGMDVYLEKPVAHNIDEGFRLAEAVRRTKRVVQVGTQRRSFELFHEAKRIIDSGVTGRIRLINAWWMNTTPAALTSPQLAGKLDWEQWLGPAPKRALNPRRFFHWQWFADYGGGYLTSQGAHIFDAINWMMNTTYPLAVSSSGRVDQQGAELPESATMSVEYADFMAVFTLDYKAMPYAFFSDQMNQFHGSKARFDLGREFFALYPQNPEEMALKPSVAKQMPHQFNSSVGVHIRNFLDCVRTRQDPSATIEQGLAASVITCLAVQSYQTGRRIRFEPPRAATA